MVIPMEIEIVESATGDSPIMNDKGPKRAAPEDLQNDVGDTCFRDNKRHCPDRPVLTPDTPVKKPEPFLPPPLYTTKQFTNIVKDRRKLAIKVCKDVNPHLMREKLVHLSRLTKKKHWDRYNWVNPNLKKCKSENEDWNCKEI